MHGTPTDTIEFYDRFWQEHRHANPLQLERCAAILGALHATGLREPRIVELGSGAGWLTSVLGQFGPALGVELSPVAVEAARRRYPHAEFVAADITGWPAPKQAFDVVVSSEVIEHLAEPGRHLGTVRELLRPGGFLILTTPNATTMRAMPDAQRQTWSAQPIENWLTRHELVELARAAGLRPLRVRQLTPGFGERGGYRLANSARLGRMWSVAGLDRAWNRARLAAGFGLHLLMLARRE